MKKLKDLGKLFFKFVFFLITKFLSLLTPVYIGYPLCCYMLILLFYGQLRRLFNWFVYKETS